MEGNNEFNVNLSQRVKESALQTIEKAQKKLFKTIKNGILISIRKIFVVAFIWELIVVVLS